MSMETMEGERDNIDATQVQTPGKRNPNTHVMPRESVWPPTAPKSSPAKEGPPEPQIPFRVRATTIRWHHISLITFIVHPNLQINSYKNTLGIE